MATGHAKTMNGPISRAAPSRRGRGLANALTMLVSVLVALALAEGGFRIYLSLSAGGEDAVVKPSTQAPDDRLGWQVKPHIRITGALHDAAGRRYRLDYSTVADGFRRYGDPASPRAKLLAIGDSHTQGEFVSDGQLYYDHLARLLPIEVFAYGNGGFGTLQEYMVLDRHLDAIAPDIVLWQFSSNDLINNHEGLERASILHNNGLWRPYLQPDGRVVYRLPKPMPWLRHLAAEHSKLLYFLLSRADSAKAAAAMAEGRVLHHRIIEQLQNGERHTDLDEAAAVTLQLIGTVQNRLGTTPLIAFIADDQAPFRQVLENSLDVRGVPFARDIPAGLNAAAGDAPTIFAFDHIHWNADGHAAAALLLSELLKRRFPQLAEAGADPTATDARR